MYFDAKNAYLENFPSHAVTKVNIYACVGTCMYVHLDG